MSNIQAWILATRPKTLPAAVGPVLVGSAMAFADDKFAFLPALAALGIALLLQVGVNLANDYFDGVKGIDTKERLGPIRVTQSGLISPAGVKSAMILTFALAAVIGLYLIFKGGWPVICIGAVSILAALGYSGGPFPLASHGLGDAFVFIFFGWVAVGGTYYVQALQVTWLVFVMASVIGFLITAILVVNNLRDMRTDQSVGKNTLAVIMGGRRSKIEYALLLILSYGILLATWIVAGMSIWILLPLVSLPWAISLVRTVWRSSIDAGLNILLAKTAAFSFFYSVLLSLGLVAA